MIALGEPINPSSIPFQKADADEPKVQMTLGNGIHMWDIPLPMFLTYMKVRPSPLTLI